jgi:DNA polymerase-3 subunit gamma/tau
VLIDHLAGICAKEGVKVSAEALSLVTRAAEGSVRDALSLLDQAIAHGSSAGAEEIGAATIRDMLGVADRARIVDLFEHVMKGDIAAAMTMLKEQYDQGADPALVLSDLAEFVHFVTRLRLVPDAKPDAAVTPEELKRGREFAAVLTAPVLTRAWQILSKGIADVRHSPRPLAAGDMVMVRLAHASDLPTPEDVLKRLQNAPLSSGVPASMPSGGGSGGGGGSVSAIAQGATMRMPAAISMPQNAPRAHAGPRIASLQDIVTLAQTNRDIQLKIALESDVHPVRIEEGRFEFALAKGASAAIVQQITNRLKEWTGNRWIVTISNEAGEPTLRELRDAKDAERMRGVRAEPLVRSVLERFPGAEIVAVRTIGDVEPVAASYAPQQINEDVIYADTEVGEDDEDL